MTKQKKTIPITILTGFLGSGKTTLINQIIKENKDIKFGLIINEFGEEGIDGDLVTMSSKEDIVEISDGCLCCVARTDLIDSARKLIDTGKIDYIIIETSGLAEPLPIAQTFAIDNLNGEISLDSVICLIDMENHNFNKDNFRIVLEQINTADVILLNKVENITRTSIDDLKENLKLINPHAFVMENNPEFNTQTLIDTGKWTLERITDQNLDKLDDEQSQCKSCGGDCDSCSSKENFHDCKGEDCSCDCHSEKKHNAGYNSSINDDRNNEEDHNHSHQHNHTHEHTEIDEFVYTTPNKLDIEKFQDWVLNRFPETVVRAKGFVRFNHEKYHTFLFQMVGAKKILTEFKPKDIDFNSSITRLVFIGKKIDKEKIKVDLSEIEIK